MKMTASGGDVRGRWRISDESLEGPVKGIDDGDAPTKLQRGRRVVDGLGDGDGSCGDDGRDRRREGRGSGDLIPQAA